MTREGELENQLERTNALNKILVDTDRMQRQMLKYFKNMTLVIMICFSVIVCCMVGGFFWYEDQFDIVTTDSTDKTTTLTTSGENANINNVTDGDRYNDNAVHNGGK